MSLSRVLRVPARVGHTARMVPTHTTLPHERFAALVDSCGKSRSATARSMEIDPRTLRRYCSGELPVPRVVWLAAERLRDLRTIAELDAGAAP